MVTSGTPESENTKPNNSSESDNKTIEERCEEAYDELQQMMSTMGHTSTTTTYAEQEKKVVSQNQDQQGKSYRSDGYNPFYDIDDDDDNSGGGGGGGGSGSGGGGGGYGGNVPPNIPPFAITKPIMGGILHAGNY
jgi:membrane-bound lytic murein transglycosylase